MRILVHDYAGHAFVFPLSRRLAERGHDVLHAYCRSTHTPRGVTEKQPEDVESFHICPIDLGKMIPKTGYWRRLRMEIAYAGLLADECRRFEPDVVLSANTPSIPQWRLVRECRQRGIRHIFWVQDVYGLAAYKLLRRKLPIVGSAVGRSFIYLDRQSARQSDTVVVITEDFQPLFERWGVDRTRIHVVQNWSVLNDLPPRPRNNDWSSQQNLTDGIRLVYSGTLAMKHNPALLLDLAKLLDERRSGQMIVVTEGAGAEWLQREAVATGIRSLVSLPFQPFEKMAEVLGSADVLVAILEPDAGAFSVPSKVLSYMCAGKPILGAIPLENLAARTIVGEGAGRVVEPTDFSGFRRSACELIDSPTLRDECGKSARRYAEENFDMDKITERFERMLCPDTVTPASPIEPAFSHDLS